jgi:hypothetical protein
LILAAQAFFHQWLPSSERPPRFATRSAARISAS